MKTSDKSAFTLIELLIVITILAILAGAAVPYAFRYIEDSRYAKVKTDLEEIRNAIVRWEIDRAPWLDADTNPAIMVGPYLSKAPMDPWGAPYVISNQKSIIFSYGPDRASGGGDDIRLNFRPAMAVSRLEYKDRDSNEQQSAGDQIVFYCTRAVNTINDGASILFENTNGAMIDGTIVFGPAPLAGNIFANRVEIDITDPAGWPGGFTLKNGGKVEVKQIAGQEFINDFSGEPMQWAKDDERLIFKH